MMGPLWALCCDINAAMIAQPWQLRPAVRGLFAQLELELRLWQHVHRQKENTRQNLCWSSRALHEVQEGTGP